MKNHCPHLFWGICFSYLLGPAGLSSALEIPKQISIELSSLDFQKRETATEQLRIWSLERPKQAADVLYEQVRFSLDPEARARFNTVLREIILVDYESEGKGYLGIFMQAEVAAFPGQPKPCGMIRIQQVMADSAAQRAGLQNRDLIAALNGKFWVGGEAVGDFSNRVRQMKAKSKIRLKILRDGKPIDLDAVLGKRPPNMDQAQQKNRDFDPRVLERLDKEAFIKRWLELKKIAK
jgi:predicted metalloprotease with PDZ domain